MLLVPSWISILCYLHTHPSKTYTTIVAKELDITYSHTSKIIQRLEKKGFIIREKKGRMNYLRLNYDNLSFREADTLCVLHIKVTR